MQIFCIESSLQVAILDLHISTLRWPLRVFWSTARQRDCLSPLQSGAGTVRYSELAITPWQSVRGREVVHRRTSGADHGAR
uniref:Uncharacterized protein n=1 Tax=Anguilla anguilla TaxID=7936 RepID=A0A0E9TEG4_ANGAN